MSESSKKRNKQRRPSEGALERLCKLVDETNRRVHAYSLTAECFCGKREVEGSVDEEIISFIEHAVDSAIAEVIERRKSEHGSHGG